MSQSYVIRVSASVSEDVSAKDKRTKKIVLTEIVPCDEQREILRDTLREQGWEEVDGSDGKQMRRQRGKVVETIDLDELTVEATVELDRTLERSRTITVRGDRDFESEGERRTKEQASLERSIAISDEEKAQAEAALQREIAELLEESEEERTRDLNEAVREVYAESLKRKAGSLGNVTSVQESREGGEYELVIRITE